MSAPRPRPKGAGRSETDERSSRSALIGRSPFARLLSLSRSTSLWSPSNSLTEVRAQSPSVECTELRGPTADEDGVKTLLDARELAEPACESVGVRIVMFVRGLACEGPRSGGVECGKGSGGVLGPPARKTSLSNMPESRLPATPLLTLRAADFVGRAGRADEDETIDERRMERGRGGVSATAASAAGDS